ncbi:unnamed protein product [Closterium sp. NIES-53]
MTAATSLGACEPGSTGTASVEALHTFTLDSGATRCFFRDCTTVTPLTAPFPVSLADPSGGPVVARASTVLPCPVAPSGSLRGFHLPSFAKNLVSNTVLQDQVVIVTTLGGELVAICTNSRTGKHLTTFTPSPGSGLYTLTTESAQVVVSGQVPSPAPALTCTGVSSLSRGAAARGSLLLLVSANHYSSIDPPHGCEYPRCFDRLDHRYSSPAEHAGIAQSFTLPASPQQNGIAERRIGLMMEVSRTSVIHAAAPHFLWPFAVRYAAHQLNLWPCVPVPETSPTLRWTRGGGGGVWRCVGVSGLGRALPCPRYHRGQALSLHSSLPLPWLPHRRPGSFTTLPPAASYPHMTSTFTSVSQVDPPPLVEPLEVLSNTSGPAKGGDPIADDTAATHRSPRLETPPGFPPRPSSPPPQTIAVDSGAAGGGDTGGADSGGAGPEVADSKGAESGVAGSGGASSGGADTEGAASPSGGGVVGAPSGGFGDGQQLRDWVVWRGRVAGAWSTGAGGTGARGGSQDHHKVREQARGHMASPHART